MATYKKRGAKKSISPRKENEAVQESTTAEVFETLRYYGQQNRRVGCQIPKLYFRYHWSCGYRCLGLSWLQEFCSRA